MSLADVEGAHIYLKDLTIAHHMASWESIQEILIRHYNRQLLHETYKVKELIYITNSYFFIIQACNVVKYASMPVVVKLI